MTNSLHINAQADATPICPFTFKPITSIDKSDLAVIYACNPLLLQDDKNAKCGHECSLLRLTSYLHDTNVAGHMHSSCPVCQQSKIAVVCDGNAARALCPDGEGESSSDVCLSFRYGAIHYYLSLPKTSSSSRFSRQYNAISRIAAVLNMDVKHMKIIHKGKVIYPDKTNNDDVSEDIIISISSADISQKRKKPSLVVMGIRKQTYLKQTAEGGSKGILMAVIGLLSPRTLFSFVTWGIVWTLNATKSLGSGVRIFVQSMLYPPSQRSE